MKKVNVARVSHLTFFYVCVLTCVYALNVEPTITENNSSKGSDSKDGSKIRSISYKTKSDSRESNHYSQISGIDPQDAKYDAPTPTHQGTLHEDFGNVSIKKRPTKTVASQSNISAYTKTSAHTTSRPFSKSTSSHRPAVRFGSYYDSKPTLYNQNNFLDKPSPCSESHNDRPPIYRRYPSLVSSLLNRPPPHGGSDQYNKPPSHSPLPHHDSHIPHNGPPPKGNRPPHSGSSHHNKPPPHTGNTPHNGPLPHGGPPQHNKPPHHTGNTPHNGPPPHSGSPHHNKPPPHSGNTPHNGPPPHGGSAQHNKPPQHTGNTPHNGPPPHSGSPHHNKPPPHSGNTPHNGPPPHGGPAQHNKPPPHTGNTPHNGPPPHSGSSHHNKPPPHTGHVSHNGHLPHNGPPPHAGPSHHNKPPPLPATDHPPHPDKAPPLNGSQHHDALPPHADILPHNGPASQDSAPSNGNCTSHSIQPPHCKPVSESDLESHGKPLSTHLHEHPLQTTNISQEVNYEHPHTNKPEIISHDQQNQQTQFNYSDDKVTIINDNQINNEQYFDHTMTIEPSLSFNNLSQNAQITESSLLSQAQPLWPANEVMEGYNYIHLIDIK